MTIIEMRDKRTKLLATMDGFLETHRNDKGVLSAEDDTIYAGMEKDLAALTNEIKRMERREAIDADLSKPVSTPITGKPMTATAPAQTKTGRAADEYNANFWNVMRSKAPMPQVVNALQVGDDAEGGYLVPDEYEHHLVEALQEENVFRRLAHTINTDSGDRHGQPAGDAPFEGQELDDGTEQIGDNGGQKEQHHHIPKTENGGHHGDQKNHQSQKTGIFHRQALL